MKKILSIIFSIASVFVFLGFVDAVAAAPYPPALGGTGTSIIPASGTIPIGTGSGTYTPNYLLCSGNCAITNASGSVTISVPAVATATVTIFPVVVATNTFSIIGDGNIVTVSNPSTSTIKVSASVSAILSLISGTSPVAYNSSTGAISCPTCLTSSTNALPSASNGEVYASSGVLSAVTGTAGYFPIWDTSGNFISSSSLIIQSSGQVLINSSNTFKGVSVPPLLVNAATATSPYGSGIVAYGPPASSLAGTNAPIAIIPSSTSSGQYLGIYFASTNATSGGSTGGIGTTGASGLFISDRDAAVIATFDRSGLSVAGAGASQNGNSGVVNISPGTFSTVGPEFYSLLVNPELLNNNSTSINQVRINRFSQPTVKSTSSTNSIASYTCTLCVDGAPIIAASATVPFTAGLYIASGTSVGSSTANVSSSYDIYVVPETGAQNNYAAYFGGSVGINTSTPSNALTIQGGTAFIQLGQFFSGFDGIGFGSGALSAGNYAFGGATTGQTFVNAATGQNISFRINNAENAQLTAQGNLDMENYGDARTGFSVGTTTTSTAQTLYVVGSSTFNGNALIVASATAGNVVGLQTQDSGFPTSSRVLVGSIKAGDGSYTEPQIWMGQYAASPSLTNYLFNLDDNGNGGTVFNAPAGNNLSFRVSNVTYMKINGATHNVGIQTGDNPASTTLQVGGASSTIEIGTASGTANPGCWITWDTSGVGGKVYHYASSSAGNPVEIFTYTKPNFCEL